MPSYSRSATLVLALVGLVVNAVAAFHLARLWRSLRAEPESEWEGADKYALNGLRVVWCLLAAYFAVAAAACVVGLLGVVKRVPAYVRLYRDYSLADLGLCAVSTAAFALASFRPAVRAAVCEELERQPDLMRDLADAGLNVENCEAWFERAVVATVALMGVLLVIRLQFTLTISSYYAQLRRAAVRLHAASPAHAPPPLPCAAAPQRIFLLPHRAAHAHAPAPALVYAPVPLAALSEADARALDATEAWVAPPPHHHHHHHRHHRARGRISLPVRPGEGLLPPYRDDDAKH